MVSLRGIIICMPIIYVGKRQPRTGTVSVQTYPFSEDAESDNLRTHSEHQQHAREAFINRRQVS